MPKLAYLFGMIGSGKSWIAKAIGETHQIVVIDDLRPCTFENLDGFKSTANRKRWEIWDELISELGEFVVAAALAKAIRHECPGLDPSRHILAEGELLTKPNVRSLLRNALRQIGFTVVQTDKFWIDPPAEVVLRRRLQRGRPMDLNLTLADVERYLGWYRPVAKKNTPRRCESPEETIAAIQTFFES